MRLASRLCGWDIDIKTRGEFEADMAGPGADGSHAAPGEAEGAAGGAGAETEPGASAADADEPAAMTKGAPGDHGARNRT